MKTLKILILAAALTFSPALADETRRNPEYPDCLVDKYPKNHSGQCKEYYTPDDSDGFALGAGVAAALVGGMFYIIATDDTAASLVPVANFTEKGGEWGVEFRREWLTLQATDRQHRLEFAWRF